MGDRRVSEAEQQKSPTRAAGLLPAVAAAVVFPFDRVLAGMAAAGHGLHAICLYLGLTPTVLLEHVVRLGLATPHDRPLRKSGARGWSVLDTLRKLDPGTLEDPVPGFGFGDLPQTTQTGAAAATPATLCGHAAGRATIDASLGRTDIILPDAPAPRAEPAKRPQPHARRGHPAEGQRELQLFRVVRNPEPGPAPAPDQQPSRISRPSASVVRPVSPVPQCEEDVDFDDLTWLAHLKNPVKHRIAVWTLGLLRFGGLHWKIIAERIGRTPRATSSLLHRCDVPHDSDRSKFGSAFDREVALANLKELGFEVKLDEPRRQYFWRCKGDRAKATRNRKSRLEMGAEEPYRTRTYAFVTRRDLDARRGRDAPFAGSPAMMRAC